MPIDDQELRALQFLAERVRKSTSGAGSWDSVGLAANLRKLANRNLHMTIEHVLRHAADPAAKTPGVLLGAYTPEAPTGSQYVGPTKAALCHNCGKAPCDPACPEPAVRRPTPAPDDVRKAALDDARARIVAAKGAGE